MTVTSRDPRRLLVLAAASAALAALCLTTIDRPVARWLSTRDTWPQAWDRVIGMLEYPLGITPWPLAGAAVLVGGVLVTQLVPRWRPHATGWMLVAATHLLARNLTMWLKLGTGRLRPVEWLARGGDTFFRDGGYSFPSGHVVLFASVVLPVVYLVPRARPLLAVVGFAMAARVAVGAHFLSDVLAGLALAAAVTWLWATLLRRVAPMPTR